MSDGKALQHIILLLLLTWTIKLLIKLLLIFLVYSEPVSFHRRSPSSTRSPSPPRSPRYERSIAAIVKCMELSEVDKSCSWVHDNDGGASVSGAGASRMDLSQGWWQTYVVLHRTKIVIPIGISLALVVTNNGCFAERDGCIVMYCFRWQVPVAEISWWFCNRAETRVETSRAQYIAGVEEM